MRFNSLQVLALCLAAASISCRSGSGKHVAAEAAPVNPPPVAPPIPVIDDNVKDDDKDEVKPEPKPVIIDDQDIRHVGGQLTIGGYSRYGTQAEAEWPGARKSAMRWTDQQGRFWLFGGEGFGEKKSGRLNDLWVFDSKTVQWTWMGGATLPNAWNSEAEPGARTGAATWTGSDGRLWLFGGFTQLSETRLGYSQDLWVFDTKLGQWSFVSGTKVDQANQFDSTSTPTTGIPAGRERAAQWIDAKGRLCLFGGQKRDLDAGLILRLNDLWCYDTAAKAWTFIGGSRETNALNAKTPGARDNASAWIDADGRTWLFGGFGLGVDSRAGHLNDLWRFDPIASQWEFITGSLTIDSEGQWGERNVAGEGQFPSGREAAMAWVQGEQLCLFGGWGYSIYHFVGKPDALQDLWCFSTRSRQWTWMLGNNIGQERSRIVSRELATGSVGYPGARYGSSVWLGSKSELFIFGGAGYDTAGRGDLLQDLWRLPPHVQ